MTEAETNIVYGIDLAGFTTKKTAIVMAKKNAKNVTLTIIDDHPLKKKDDNQSKKYILDILSNYPVYVDAPVDVQKLPFDKIESFCYQWQLTHRPVDYAYRGLPPFADRIGFIVVRLMHYLYEADHKQLQNLFETYPAGSMRQLNILGNEEQNNEPKYKDSLVYIDKDGWGIECPDSLMNEYIKKTKKANNSQIKKKFIKTLEKAGISDFNDSNIESLFNKESHSTILRDRIIHEMSGNEDLLTIAKRIFVNVKSKKQLQITDDEFDAMICATTGLLGKSELSGEELRKKIKIRLESRLDSNCLSLEECEPPERYVLINNLSEINNMVFTIERK